MTSRTSLATPQTSWTPALVPSPFLHVEKARIYNPLTGETLVPGQPAWEVVLALAEGRRSTSTLADEVRESLTEGLWVFEQDHDPSSRFRLKYVSLEAHTVCNQACYFCPVSVNPRPAYFMPTELYERILSELAAFSSTIEAVFMINYNEPTVDRRFVEQVRAIKSKGLPPAVLTNGAGLTPDRIDALVAMGGLKYLSVNLSTLDRELYLKERGVDQVELVLRNLEHAKDKPLAPQMDIVVLGRGDAQHFQDHKAIEARFAGTRFNVRPFEVMDRAGYLPVGLRPIEPHRRLRGCENVGSRPLEHLHITPHGKCVLCCEDYDENHVVGDLTKDSVVGILTGPALSRFRRWAYGVEEAPEDFICRKCVFARAS